MAAWLKKTCHGLTAVILPPDPVKPPGWFIQEFTAITDIAPKMPDTAIGTPDHQCTQPGSRCQPHRYTPAKMASRKKKSRSTANGNPSTDPDWRISPGQSRPISNDSTVPVTAPTAMSTP